MNWKLQAGILLDDVEQMLIKSGLGFVNDNFPFGRDWLFDVKRILAVNPGVIIDAGANVGSISKGLNYWFPDAAIYAFKPVTETYKMLVANTAAKKNIHPVQLALGNVKMVAEIYLNQENTINSLKVEGSTNKRAAKEDISVVRLDDFLRDNQIASADILKIDVEGFEFEVLKGCGTLLENDIQVVYFEVGYQREATKVHFSEVEPYMESKDFLLCGIYETRRNLLDKRKLWYANNLYIKKNILAA